MGRIGCLSPEQKVQAQPWALSLPASGLTQQGGDTLLRLTGAPPSTGLVGRLPGTHVSGRVWPTMRSIDGEAESLILPLTRLRVPLVSSVGKVKSQTRRLRKNRLT